MNYLLEIASRIKAEVPESLLPDSETRNLFILYALIALSRGTSVTAEDVHNAWNAWMLLRGENHPSMVPFEELSKNKKEEDNPFLEAIRRVVAQFNQPR